MEKHAKSLDKKVPFMIGIKGGTSVLYNEVEEVDSCEMKLTIFYDDLNQDRKFLTCSLLCKKMAGNYFNEIKISFEGHEQRKRVIIPQSVEVGDFIAYIRHSIIPDRYSEQREEKKYNDEPIFIYNKTSLKNQKYIQVFDSRATMIELVNRPLDKGVIMIRDNQNMLRALVSKVEMEGQHENYTEAYELIDRISHGLCSFMKSEFAYTGVCSKEKSFKSNDSVLNQRWKGYIDFFEKEEVKNQMNVFVDYQSFLDMIKEIKRIAILLYVNNQVFLSDQDKSTLRDAASYFHLLKNSKK